jgi:hypothetical protein
VRSNVSSRYKNRSFNPLTISHVFGQTGKKEFGIDNVKITNSAWDTNIISASGVRTMTCIVLAAQSDHLS